MTLSLTKIDEKLAAKRAAVADLVRQREDAFAKIDAISDAVDALQALEAPSDEQAKELETKLAALKDAQRGCTAIGEKVRAAQQEVFDLESLRRDREEHLRQSAEARVQTPRASQGGLDFDAGARVVVQEPTAEQKDEDIACYMRNRYIAKVEGLSFTAVCEGRAGDQFRNDRLLAAANKTNNAAVLPPVYIPRVVELLRSRTVIRKMAGIRNLPMANGNLRIPRHSAGSTANYVGELTNITATDVTTENINLSSKKLTALVVSSGELMRQSSPAANALIRDDMIKAIASKEDSTFIRAAGSTTVPKGLKAFADLNASTQVIAANATVNLANVTTDLGKLILALANADSPMLNPYFLLAPRSERYLMDLRDGNGNLAFPEMRDGFLRAYPYMTTTNIPINLGVGTNRSEVYFADASELIIADAPTFDVSVSTEAAYHDGSNVQAAFSQDAVVFRVIVEHDTAMRHDKSVAYLSDVLWGT